MSITLEQADSKGALPAASAPGQAPQETFVLNIGPQHPATHGVLRVKMTMDGEYIVKAEPVCGYIHRMHEKMGENRTYAQFLPNTSRIDYLSAMNYTHAFVGAVERALKLPVPPRAEYIRVITSELNRISSHLVWWGAFLLDLGGFTPLLYAFDDREKILDLLEGITGARLTYCYYRIGGLYNDVDDTFLKGTREFVAQMRPRLKMYKALVTENVILRKRLIDIGPISPELCRKDGATGPVIRGSGVAYDVRRLEPVLGLSRIRFRNSALPGRRLDGALPGADGGDGPEPPDHRAGPGQVAGRAGDGGKGPARVEAAGRRLLLRGRSRPRPVHGAPGQRRQRNPVSGEAAHAVPVEPEPLRGGQPRHVAARCAGAHGKFGPGDSGY